MVQEGTRPSVQTMMQISQLRDECEAKIAELTAVYEQQLAGEQEVERKERAIADIKAQFQARIDEVNAELERQIKAVKGE